MSARYSLLYTSGVDVVVGEDQAGTIRVAVTGGRAYDDRQTVFETLSKLHAEAGISELGSGCARGLDALAIAWAEELGVSYRRYNADWDRYGTLAGIYRNQAMLDDFQPDRLLVFPGGTGTTDCTRRARKMNIERQFIEEITDPFSEATRWG